MTVRSRFSFDKQKSPFEEATLDEEEAAEAVTVARNDLEEYAYRLKGSLEQLQAEVMHTLSWLEGAGESAGREEFEEKKLRLQENIQ